MESIYVYILQCSDQSYYVGHTNSPERREQEHNEGKAFCSYTFSKRPVKMVYAQECPNRPIAFLLERKIKGWTRKKKESLIKGEFDALKALSKKKFNLKL